MKNEKKKIVKIIKVNLDKCNGCRACEMVCSAFHATPKYSSDNPGRSRIQVIHEPLKDIYVPVRAGEYTSAECVGKGRYTIDGKQYDRCTFCNASCPSRDLFKEPDSGLPLKCDMCESDPSLVEPMCVQWCLAGALIYEEKEEEEVDEETQDDMEIRLKALTNKHGMKKVINAVLRMSMSKESNNVKTKEKKEN